MFVLFITSLPFPGDNHYLEFGALSSCLVCVFSMHVYMSKTLEPTERHRIE